MKWKLVKDGLPDKNCLCIILTKRNFHLDNHLKHDQCGNVQIRKFIMQEGEHGKKCPPPFGIKDSDIIVIAYFVIPLIPADFLGEELDLKRLNTWSSRNLDLIEKFEEKEFMLTIR